MLTNQIDEPQRLMTIKQTAILLGCSAANVYALIDSGELPVISVGKSRGYRIDQRDIEEFLSRRKTWKGEARQRVPLPRPRLRHIRL